MAVCPADNTDYRAGKIDYHEHREDFAGEIPRYSGDMAEYLFQGTEQETVKYNTQTAPHQSHFETNQPLDIQKMVPIVPCLHADAHSDDQPAQILHQGAG